MLIRCCYIVFAFAPASCWWVRWAARESWKMGRFILFFFVRYVALLCALGAGKRQAGGRQKGTKFLIFYLLARAQEAGGQRGDSSAAVCCCSVELVLVGASLFHWQEHAYENWASNGVTNQQPSIVFKRPNTSDSDSLFYGLYSSTVVRSKTYSDYLVRSS